MVFTLNGFRSCFSSGLKVYEIYTRRKHLQNPTTLIIITYYYIIESEGLKACRTRELSAELTVTRDHWRKQNPPVCGKILRDFWHA